LTGNALLHGDLRTDNFIATTNGQLYLVDWTNLISGPAWIDLATLLPELARSGLDAMDVWRRSPWADTPPHHLDVMLAAMAGYWYNAGARPPIPHAPGLRTLQQVQAKSALKLLEQRLGSYQRPSRSANSYTPK
jgi:Ser/Thr protein kinase RdoA (MazF antagonist)